MADDKETEQETLSFEEIKREIDNPTGKNAQLRSDLKFLNMLSPERRERLIQEVFEGRAEEAHSVIGKATRGEDLTPKEQALLDEIRVALGVKERDDSDQIER